MKLEKTINRKHKITGKYIALSAVLLFVNPIIVMSAEWVFEPSIRMGAIYDDNFRLSTVAEPASGMTLHPKIRLSKRTEVSEIKLSGHTHSSRYDNSRFDSDEIELDLASSFQNTERSTFKLNADISRKPLNTTEEEDSGRFETGRDKDQMTFNPSWDYTLSESSRLQVYYSGQDVDYNGSTSHTDYQYHSLVGSYLFRQSEKNQYSISLVASRYDPNHRAQTYIGENCIGSLFGGHCTNNDGDRDPEEPIIVEEAFATSNITDSIGFHLGVSRNFSQTLIGNVKIGLTRSENTLIRDATPFETDHADEFTFMTPTAVSTGIINTVTESTLTTLEASLTKNYELTSIVATLKNSLKPSSNGTLNESASAELEVEHEMSSRLKLSANLKADSNQTQGSTSVLDRDFYTASLRASWQLSKWWRLGANYRYRQQKYDASSGSIDSNRVAVTLAYAGPKKSISR